MKNRLFKLSKYTSYFENKNNLIIFLILLTGVIVPVCSGTETFNFWYKLNFILTSPFFNMMFFLSIGLNVIFLSSELSKSYNIVCRCSNYKELIKNFANDIISTTIILSLVSVILAVAGSIILSFGDFSMISHENYNIPIAIYLIFFIIRCAVFSCIINTIIYLVFLVSNKLVTMIVLLFTNVLFLMLPYFKNVIMHFYKMPYLYHYYFLEVKYSSLLLEIICSILQTIILLIIYKILLKIVTIKKRDLL